MLTAPYQLLRKLKDQFALTLFPPPLALPKISVAQLWHERQHDDPAHAWLRAMIVETLAVNAPPPAKAKRDRA